MRGRVEGPQTPYESYCYRCHVTFPVDYPSCVHCGERLGRERLLRVPSVGEAPVPEAPIEVIDEEKLATPRFGRLSPIALLWLVLALGGAVYRACSGG